jgi:hypothetical protein
MALSDPIKQWALYCIVKRVNNKYLKNHDDPVETLVNLQHVGVIDLVRVNGVLGNGTHVLTLLPAGRRAIVGSGGSPALLFVDGVVARAVNRCLLQTLRDVLQDAVHVGLAQEELADGVDLVENLLEPDFVSCEKKS